MYSGVANLEEGVLRNLGLRMSARLQQEILLNSSTMWLCWGKGRCFRQRLLRNKAGGLVEPRNAGNLPKLKEK